MIYLSTFRIFDYYYERKYNLNKNYILVDSYFYKYLENGDNEKTYEHFAKHAKDNTLEKFEFIYIPVNLNNAHWTLVKLDLLNKRVYYGDSLKKKVHLQIYYLV